MQRHALRALNKVLCDWHNCMPIKGKLFIISYKVIEHLNAQWEYSLLLAGANCPTVLWRLHLHRPCPWKKQHMNWDTLVGHPLINKEKLMTCCSILYCVLSRFWTSWLSIAANNTKINSFVKLWGQRQIQWSHSLILYTANVCLAKCTTALQLKQYLQFQGPVSLLSKDNRHLDNSFLSLHRSGGRGKKRKEEEDVGKTTEQRVKGRRDEEDNDERWVVIFLEG